MAVQKLEVAEDIREAYTIPSAVYSDPAYYALARERIFARCWHFLTDSDRMRTPGHLLPRTVLEGCLDEPILLTRDQQDQLHCLSNICTHRGNLLVEGEGNQQVIRCRYHGRRFGLDGRMLSMPEFEEVVGFPSAEDNLPRVPSAQWGKFLFAAIEPAFSFDEWFGPITERLAWLPIEQFTFAAASSRDYLVRANWALYCDNYLEGFHIPYVHAGLAEALDYGSYRTELFAWSNLQVGIASGDEDVFDLPASSPDRGQRIAAYYWWLFPNTMFNFYPWGISVNVVRPLAPDLTKVSFLPFVWDASRLDRGAGAGLDRVEREDEAIVESVQRGVRSRLYTRGRYSPAREQGVHHFHRLLVEAMKRA